MDAKIQTSQLNLWYGRFHALKNINVSIRPRAITAIIGPSGCGKSTLLRSFNRLNDLIGTVRMEGSIRLDGQEILQGGCDMSSLRRRVGMVFQRPNPFPLSVFDNVAYGLRVQGVRSRSKHRDVVEQSLHATALWDALKDRLNEPALELSPEQQQRLCISRLLAVKPEVLLMDEPCSSLDPVATENVEELMRGLASEYTIVIVTHNMQQAARVSHDTGFMLLGDLVEFGPTQKIFTAPSDKRTEDYVTGRYG